MGSAVRKGAFTSRYMLTKLIFATEEFMHTLINPKVAEVGQQRAGVIAQALATFREAYSKQMTSTMYMAGAAMYPSLNRKVTKDPEAVEKLVVRLLPRPTARNVWVGDVVALNSPLGKPSETQVMVRRVAAVEGMEMVPESSNTEDEEFQIPPGHCWVLADNPDMKPPQVIDSRTFGFVPMSNILGRVIYSGTSPTEHAPVVNSPTAQMVDDPILEQEVLLAGLFADDQQSESEEGKGK